jgi:hypothetical protein
VATLPEEQAPPGAEADLGGPDEAEERASADYAGGSRMGDEATEE